MIADGEGYQPVVIPLPTDLKELLSSDSTKLEDILNRDITFRLFRTNEPTMISFLSKHIDQLLSLSFDPKSDQEISAKAFAILEHSQQSLTKLLLEKQRIHNTACTVLANPVDLNPLFLNRLASLTLTVIYYDPALIIGNCGYILQLIPFVTEPSILSLFESLCSPNEDKDFIQIQKWMNSVGFTEVILKELDDFPVQMESATLLTPSANYYSALLRLVAVCGSSPIFGPSVCTYQFVTALNRTAGNYPLFVENQRWEAISAIYCQQTKDAMHGFFPLALEILDDKLRCNTRSGTAAIDLLSVMVEIDPVLLDFIISSNVPQKILNLVINFPDATLLHISVIDFIKIALQNNQIRKNFAQDLYKILLTTFQQTNKCVRATLYKIFRAIVKLSKANPKIASDFKQFTALSDIVKGPMQDYRTILKNQYGGGFRYAEVDDIQSLAQKAIYNLGL